MYFVICHTYVTVCFASGFRGFLNDMRYINSCFTYLFTYFAAVFQSIENNWQTGNHSIQRILCRSEASKGVYCLQYDDQKIISGLRDNTIKVSVALIVIIIVIGGL